MAENLIRRGFEVTLLQRGDQVLAPLDKENASVVEAILRE